MIWKLKMCYKNLIKNKNVSQIQKMNKGRHIDDKNSCWQWDDKGIKVKTPTDIFQMQFSMGIESLREVSQDRSVLKTFFFNFAMFFYQYCNNNSAVK